MDEDREMNLSDSELSGQPASGSAEAPVEELASTPSSHAKQSGKKSSGKKSSGKKSSGKKRKKRSRIGDIIPIIGLLLGLAIIAYYPATEAIDAYKRAQVASQIDATAELVDTSTLDEIFAQAEAYNQVLAGLTPSIDYDDIWDYEDQLNIDGHNTAFGYVIIPSISLTMPIYHGTSDAVLSAGAGHLESSSLPVGGESTHTVITAHSGLANTRAFDDIRQLEVGDVFGIKVYGELICYEVTSIEVVLPSELDSLQIVVGEDLATLVTCTPYGVNTHRLLVHGTRCEVPDDFNETVNPLASVVKSRRMLPFLIALAIVLALLVFILIGNHRRKKKRKQKAEEKAAAAAAAAAGTERIVEERSEPPPSHLRE